MQKTIIRIRKGINGFKYSACDEKGNFIGNFKRLADVRHHWKIEIKHKRVILIRELNKFPELSAIDDTTKCIDKILGCVCQYD